MNYRGRSLTNKLLSVVLIAALLHLPEDSEGDNQCTWGIFLIFPNSVLLEGHALVKQHGKPGAHLEGAWCCWVWEDKQAILLYVQVVENSWRVWGRLGRCAATGETLKCSSGISAAASQLHVWTPSSCRPPSFLWDSCLRAGQKQVVAPASSHLLTLCERLMKAQHS